MLEARLGARGWERRARWQLRVEGHPAWSRSPRHSMGPGPHCPGPRRSLRSVKPGDRGPWRPAVVGDLPGAWLLQTVGCLLSGHPARRTRVAQAQQSTRCPHTQSTHACHLPHLLSTRPFARGQKEGMAGPGAPAGAGSPVSRRQLSAQEGGAVRGHGATGRGSEQTQHRHKRLSPATTHPLVSPLTPLDAL